MTIAEWLDRRAASAPTELAARVRAELAASLEREASEVPEAAFAAADRLLTTLLHGRGEGEGEGEGGGARPRDGVARDAATRHGAVCGGVVRDRRARAEALDLLTVDALVTYALERLSEVPELVPSWADAAMVRVASVASGAHEVGARGGGAGT